MNLVDLAIILLIILSAGLGFRSGLIQSATSLIGLIAGIAIASWNYRPLTDRLEPYIKNHALSEAAAFCLIAILVMAIFGLIGMVLRKLIHGIGLGWLDRLAGLVFGILRGALLVTLCIVTLAAFFPQTRWLGESQFGKYFLGSAHLTTEITPEELKVRILDGLQVLEQDAPKWLRQK
jgi:membrane protein required for colicin V production